jgi:hypothetical protein
VTVREQKESAERNPMKIICDALTSCLVRSHLATLYLCTDELCTETEATCDRDRRSAGRGQRHRSTAQASACVKLACKPHSLLAVEAISQQKTFELQQKTFELCAFICVLRSPDFVLPARR